VNIDLIPAGDDPPNNVNVIVRVGRWGDADESRRVLMEAIERAKEKTDEHA
jgi:hypothetical protein